MGLKCMLNNVRCAFLVLGEPEEFKAGDGKPRWSATALVPYNSPIIKQVEAAMKQIDDGFRQSPRQRPTARKGQ